MIDHVINACIFAFSSGLGVLFGWLLGELGGRSGVAFSADREIDEYTRGHRRR